MFTQNTSQLMAVYKFPLSNVARLPKGSTVISVEQKGDGVFLYAQVPLDEKEKELHFFHILATGDPFRAEGTRYIGSYMINHYYIYHVYEVPAILAAMQADEVLSSWNPSEDSKPWNSPNDGEKAADSEPWDISNGGEEPDFLWDTPDCVEDTEDEDSWDDSGEVWDPDDMEEDSWEEG